MDFMKLMACGICLYSLSEGAKDKQTLEVQASQGHFRVVRTDIRVVPSMTSFPWS